MMRMTTKSTMALALIALVLGNAAMALKHGRHQKMDNNGEMIPHKFQAGHEYNFRYDAQTSTGYSSLEISRQRAINRLQALVKVVFQSSTEAVLSMHQIRTAQLSEVPAVDAWNPARLQPISAFENRVLPTEQDEQSEEMHYFNSQLSLPVQFQYTEDGMVENIRFKKSENTVTKNIKKAVLNLIQLNLRPIVKDDVELDKEVENKKKLSSSRMQSSEEWFENWVGNSYTNVENTIEGQCETTYVVSPNSWEKENREQQKWNVTKSINFERCSVLADVAYGFQVEPTLGIQNWKQEDITVLEKDLFDKQRYGQVVPKEQLERSTVLRYVLSAPQKEEMKHSVAENFNKFGIERVELLSEYTVQNSKLHSNQAMRTVAVAELNFLKCVENNDVESSDEILNKKSSHQNFNDDEQEGLGENLIYNADFESLEKKFMMFGDEKYPDDAKLPVSRLFMFDKSNNDVTEQGKKMLKIAERQLDAAVRAFVTNEDENAEGINAPETAENLWNLVYIMRICTVSGLRKLHERATAASKEQKSALIARELFVNALALSGTRNSIALLVEMIENRVIDESKASQVLKTLGSGAGLPAISESQVDLVLKLCKSNTLESEALKRSCWLTFGTMVGELSQQSEKAKNLYETKAPLKSLELATAHKMDLYKQVLLDGLKNADQTEDSYAKIIALKAIGNAGLSSTIESVIKIVQNAEVPHDIRLHAIDALRRICHRQPENQTQLGAVYKVQFGLLPVFQNVNERSDVRMATAAMLLTNAVTINTPSKHALIDQIVYAIQNDKNEDVIQFVSQILEGLSKSPIYEHQKIAQHLKNSFTMVKLSNKTIKQILKSSQYNRNTLRCCSRVRSFLNFMNIYASDRSNAKHFSAESKTNTKLIPSQMAIELDSFVNGQYQRNSLQMSVIQNNFDTVLKELLLLIDINKYDYENMNEEELKTKNSGFLSNAAKQINSLFRKLNIKDRNDNNDELVSKKTYAFITLRNNDIDVVVEPITVEDILSILKIKSSTGNLQKLKSSFSHVIRRLSNDFTETNGIMRFNSAIVLDSKFAHVPTSVGMPLKICRGALVFGTLNLKNKQGQEESAIFAIQPNFNYVEQQYMRVWMAPSAGVSAGVAWYRAAEFNLPLEVEVKTIHGENDKNNFEREAQIVCNFHLPQKNTRVFGLHTLPSLFISWKSSKQAESNENVNVHFKKSFDQIDATIETSVIEVPIHNEQLSQQQREVDLTILKNEKVSLPFHIHGIYHYPREWTIAEFSKITKSSENSIHIDFSPIESETPREIKFTITTNMYQSLFKTNRKDEIVSQPWSVIRNSLEDFYGKFENTFFNENNKKQFLNSEEQSEQLEKRQQLNKLSSEEKNYGSALKLTHQYLEKNLAKSVSYKHSMNILIETVGARLPLKADAEISAVCDSKFRACESRVEIIRSPILADERQQWTMELQSQSVYPETILNVQELNLATSAQKRHLKMFANIQAQWGIPTEKKALKINILGEPSEEMIRKAIDVDNKYQLRLREAKRREESEARIQQIESERPMSPFMDQFHTVVEYQLGATEQNFVRRCIEILKTQYFWNTKCELNAIPYTQAQTQLLKATLRVDTMTRHYANLSLETPDQRILIQSLELPFMYHLDLVAARRESLILRHSSPNPITGLFSKIRHTDDRQIENESEKECFIGKKNGKEEQNFIETFDGVKYNAPISKCYNIIAKDCTNVNRQPVYAVLAKQYGNGNQKTIKVISNYGTFEIEPTSENSKTLQVLYNEKTYTLASATAEDLEELDRHGLVFNEQQQGVTVTVPSALVLEFDSRYVHIRLSSEFKNTQCGLCGHYDDKLEDEFRMSNNKLTTDIKQFHRSFTVQEDSECSTNDLENFYNTEKFYLKDKQNEKTQPMKFSKIAKKHMTESTEETMPVEQTVVYEYNQKMCFSLKPVAQCPVGWYSTDLSGEQDLLKRTKVPFACVERSSIEAKRLKKIVRNIGFVDMSDYAPSYSELMVLPERCIQY